jgi:hypothetical protein
MRQTEIEGEIVAFLEGIHSHAEEWLASESVSSPPVAIERPSHQPRPDTKELEPTEDLKR